MGNNIKQIALMQIRRGRLDELPYALEEGEFGLATDTLDLFVGAPNSDKIKHRISEKVFPYGNLRVLTELSESLKISAYTYHGNLEIGALFPIILHGTTTLPIIPATTSFEINGVTITLNEATDLVTLCTTINNENIPNVRAYDLNDNFVIVSTTNALNIKNISGTFLQVVGLALTGINEIAEVASDLTETTLQKVLDEYLTIKHYGVKGDGTTDDSHNINEALLGTYCVKDLPQYLRTIYFPAGTYISSDETINIPSDARLIGEGRDRTIIQAPVDAPSVLLGLMDKNYVPFNSPNYGGTNVNPDNITIESMTFTGLSTNTSEVVVLTNGQNVTFRNCSFIGNQASTQKLIYIISTSAENSNVHITFEDCQFKNSGYAVYISDYGLVKHLTMTNCCFDNIKNEAIYVNPQGWANTTKTFIQNACFSNCSLLTNSVIYIGKQATNNVILNCQFDTDVASFAGKTIPYIDESDSLYTNILDPRTDNRKVYTFNYPGPKWKYIDSLVSVTGEYILKPIYDMENGTEAQVNNYLYIKPGSIVNSTIEIYSQDKFAELSLNGGKYANLIIGSAGESYPTWQSAFPYKVNDYVVADGEVYKCIKDHVSTVNIEVEDETLWTPILHLSALYVIMGKNLDLGGNIITNEATGKDLNITFRTNRAGVLTIQDRTDYSTDTVTDIIPAYEERIDLIQNAIPTVAYLKKNVTNRTFKKLFNMSDYINSPNIWNILELFTASSEVYSNTIYLRNITISVENVFEKYDFSNIKEWQADDTYYIGDAVRVGATYYVCIIANSDAVFDATKWDEIEQNGINPESVSVTGVYNDGYNTITKTFIPAKVVKLYEPENLFPNVDNPKIGNVYSFNFDRNINIANYAFNLSITDLSQQNVATNFQPAGSIFISVDFIVN